MYDHHGRPLPGSTTLALELSHLRTRLAKLEEANAKLAAENRALKQKFPALDQRIEKLSNSLGDVTTRIRETRETVFRNWRYLVTELDTLRDEQDQVLIKLFPNYFPTCLEIRRIVGLTDIYAAERFSKPGKKPQPDKKPAP